MQVNSQTHQHPTTEPKKLDLPHFLKSKKAKVIALTLLVILSLLLTSAIALNKVKQQKPTSIPQSYEECLKAPGSKTQLSYPSVCVTQDGQRFVQPLSVEEEQVLQIPTIAPEFYVESTGSATTIAWTTYTNSDTEFTLQYPANWTINTISYPIEISNKTSFIQIFTNGNFDDLYKSFNLDQQQEITIGNTIVNHSTYTREGEYSKYHIFTSSNKPFFQIQARIHDSDAPTFTQILSTFQFIDPVDDQDGEVDYGFECPDAKVLDCSPCTKDPCPMFFPSYCAKGSAQYNWIIENCPDVTVIGLE